MNSEFLGPTEPCGDYPIVRYRNSIARQFANRLYCSCCKRKNRSLPFHSLSVAPFAIPLAHFQNRLASVHWSTGILRGGIAGLIITA